MKNLSAIALFSSLIFSFQVFAQLDLADFEVAVKESLAMGRVAIECTYHVEDLEKIHADINTISAIHGIEERLPLGDEMCLSAIENAQENGVSNRTIIDFFDKKIDQLNLISDFRDNMKSHPDQDMTASVIKLKASGITFMDIKKYAELEVEELFLVKLTFLSLRSPLEKQMDAAFDSLN